MKRHMWKMSMVIVVAAVCCIISGCSSENGQSEAQIPDEEITLKVWHEAPDYQKDVFQAKVAEKYPTIHLEFLGGDIHDLVASGTIPDMLIRGNAGDIAKLVDLDVLMPLDDLVKKYKLDLKMIRPNMIEHYRTFGPDQKLYLMPYNLATWGMYYNRDIFDKFGVDYPTDGMTWNEVVDLAVGMTREVDGVQYRGIHPGPVQKIISQTGFPYVDPETDKSMYRDSQEMRDMMTLLKRIIEIPGNVPEEGGFEWFQAQQWSGGGDFISQQNIAMFPTWNNVEPYAKMEQESGFHWGMVSWPIWGEGYPEYGPEVEGDSFGISPHSKYPDAAFAVIQYVLSEEFQTYYIQKSGKASSLTNEVLDEVFMNLAPDRNMGGFVYHPPAKSLLSSHSPYERDSWPALDVGIEMLFQGDDVVTVLNRMQELADQAIEQVKSGK